MRDPIAVVIRPNIAELMLVLGRPHRGLFKILIASARSVNIVFSLIRTFLLNAMSNPKAPGPFTPGRFTAVFPVLPGCGFCRITLPDWSTTIWFVKRPGRVLSPPKFGCGAACVLRLEKYWTKQFPTATFPRSAGNAPTRSDG